MSKERFEVHDVCNAFPEMSDAAFVQLVADIKEHGLRELIKTFQGKIVDGKNRLRACEEAGVAPRFEEWDAKGSLVDYVVSLNLARRQLTADQKAAIAVSLLPFLENEAKERQGTRTDIVENFPPSQMGRSRDKAAKIVGINPRYISDFKNVQEDRPDLAEKIRKGEMKLYEAARELKRPAESRERSPTAMDEMRLNLIETQLDLLQSGNVSCPKCYTGKLRPSQTRIEGYQCADCGWELINQDIDDRKLLYTQLWRL